MERGVEEERREEIEDGRRWGDLPGYSGRAQRSLALRIRDSLGASDSGGMPAPSPRFERLYPIMAAEVKCYSA